MNEQSKKKPWVKPELRRIPLRQFKELFEQGERAELSMPAKRTSKRF
jgi:hypothetical protein